MREGKQGGGKDMQKQKTAASEMNKEASYTAIKIRIFPTPEQCGTIDQTFHCCRFIWNQMLADHDEFYAAADQHYIPTPAKYKQTYPFLKKVDSQALSAARVHLENAFKNFFNNPAKYHHPVFKKKKTQKFTYTTYCHHYYGRTPDSIRIQGEGVVLPKVKWVKAKLHRLPKEDWILQYAVVSKTKTGKYFCSLVFEYTAVPKQVVIPMVESTIGLKYSYSHFYVDSNGKKADPPQWMKEKQEKIKSLQRKISRMQPGSKNYQEAVHKIRLLYEHIVNQRLDYIHKESRQITNAWDAVCVRSDDFRVISQTLRFVNVLDSAFAKFRSCLDYKLKQEGKQLIAVGKEIPTTKLCHVCGAINQSAVYRKKFWTCSCCGTQLKRELNSAVNIKTQGLIQKGYCKEAAA